jgi:hypothetical protein
MGKDTTSRPGQAAGRERRKPVIIDVPAEEVRTTAPAQAADASTKPCDSVATPSASAREDKAPAAASTLQRREAGEQRPPKEEPIIPSAFATRAEARHRAPIVTAPRGARILPLLGAGLLGGAIAATLILLLARAWLISSREEAVSASDFAALQTEVAELQQASEGDQLAPLREQIAALEQDIEQLRSASAPVDEAALQDIEARLTQIESRPTQPSPDESSNATNLSAFEQRIAALERSLPELQETLGQLSARVEDAAAKAQVAEIEARFDQLSESTTRAAALGPAVAADALAAAIETGRPFERELAALRRFGLDKATIEQLAPHAATGLPTMAELSASFEAAIAAVDLTTPVSPGTGVINRLIESAQGLVEVRPAEPTQGTEPAAVVTRVRSALAHGDLATALSDREALPENAKAATADWAAATEARHAAAELVAKLRGEALAQIDSEG